MKINEIICEDTSPEEQLGGEGTLSMNLLPVLMFLKKRGEDIELSTKMSTDSLIQLVQNAGDTTFTYQSLVDAYENDEAVKELIKNFNEEEIILKSDSDPDAESDDEEHEDHGKDKDPTEVVKGMAHSASNKRTESVEEDAPSGVKGCQVWWRGRMIGIATGETKDMIEVRPDYDEWVNDENPNPELNTRMFPKEQVSLKQVA